MLDFETVSAMSREILRNHDRHKAQSRQQLARDGARLGQLVRRLAALPAWIAGVIWRVKRRG